MPFRWIPRFIEGLGSIYTPKHYPMLKGSDSEHLFSDVMRVGGDFKTVFEKQHDRAKQPQDSSTRTITAAWKGSFATA